MKYLRAIKKGIKHHFVPTKENGGQPHLLRVEIMALVLVFILGTQAVIFSGILKNTTAYSDFLQNMTASVLPAVLADETNQYRETNHISDLRVNPLLSKAAELKAEDMASKGYFSHISPSGDKPWVWFDKVGYQYTYAGENLAVDFTDSKDVTDAWINSPVHRENLVSNNYTETGIGVAEGQYEGKPTTFVVQFFASPYIASVSDIKPIATSVSRKSAVVARVITDIKTSTTHGTDTGNVLGLYTSVGNSNQSAVKQVVKNSLRDRLYEAFFVSPKKFALYTLSGVGLFFSLIILGSLLYTARRHKSNNIFSKIFHSFAIHRRQLVSVFCLVLVLGCIWAVDVYVLSSHVVLAIDSL